MNNFKKDIVIGLLFVAGIWSFISGQFIFSTVLFAMAAIYSNIVMRTQLKSWVFKPVNYLLVLYHMQLLLITTAWTSTFQDRKILGGFF